MNVARADIDALLEAVPLAALFIGHDERIVSLNVAARLLLGEGLVARHFITALRQPPVMDAIENCLRNRQRYHTRYLGNDGAQDTSYDVTASPVNFAGQTGVLVVFEDITHVEQVGQMRRDFVANVSHELRTPLTALMGFIETLQGPAKGDAKAQERFLGTMYAEANRMERLVRDLLALSRVEAEARVRPDTPQDLSAILSSVAHTLRPLTEEADARVTLNLPDAPVVVPGDADQLRQVVTNLVENAVKYGRKGGDVRLSLRIEASEPNLRAPAAVITVADDGPGIDPLHIPRLTERFYRVDSHHSREMGGTGLGLAIVKHIVNRHRGRFRIDSTLEKGSEFSVILPLSHA